MPFVHPLIFWIGAGAVSVPILIHLLNRRRFRLLDWAAMRFLLESIRKNRRRLRIEELILLALRCLVILLLALAVARFTGCGGMEALPGSGGGGGVAVFLLDDSFSMAQKHKVDTLFSRARTDLQEALERVPETDQVAILLTSREEPFFAKDFADRHELIERVKSLAAPSDRRANLAASLALAAEQFEADDGAARRLYVLSDFRAGDLGLGPTGAAQRQQIARQFAALRDKGVQVTAMDYGVAPRNNLTLERFALTDRYVLAAGDPPRLSVTVRNNGPMAGPDGAYVARDVPVVLTLHDPDVPGGAPLTRQTVLLPRIAAGEARTVELPLTGVEDPGSMVASAEIRAGDELRPDDRGEVAFHVRGVLRVLLVDGQLDAEAARDRASLFFHEALDPFRERRYANVLDVIAPRRLPDVRYEDYDLVALLHVPKLPGIPDAEGGVRYPALERLERYVRGGGGLIIFAGPGLDATWYNASLYGAGEGLLPYKLGKVVGEVDAQTGWATDEAQYVQLDPDTISDEPYLRPFAGRVASIWCKLARFFVFRAVEEKAVAPSDAAVGPPRVVARFNDEGHSPAIVARRYGRGRVVTVLTSANRQWTDWPVPLRVGEVAFSSYVEFVQEALYHLARPERQDYTDRLDAPVVFALEGELRDVASALLRTPDPQEPPRRPGYGFDRIGEQVEAVAVAASKEDGRALRQLCDEARKRCVAQDLAGFAESLAQLTEQIEKLAPSVEAAKALHAELADVSPHGMRRYMQQRFHVRPTEAGVYTVELEPADGPTRRVFFARNVEPEEGRLEPGGIEGLRTAFDDDAFAYRNQVGQAEAQAQAAGEQKEYWLWALGAMLVLLAAETFLAQRFGHYTS